MFDSFWFMRKIKFNHMSRFCPTILFHYYKLCKFNLSIRFILNRQIAVNNSLLFFLNILILKLFDLDWISVFFMKYYFICSRLRRGRRRLKNQWRSWSRLLNHLLKSIKEHWRVYKRLMLRNVLFMGLIICSFCLKRNCSWLIYSSLF